MIRLNLLPPSQRQAFLRLFLLRAFYALLVFAGGWTLLFFLIIGQSWAFIAIQNNALRERVLVEEGAEAAQALLAFEEAATGTNSMVSRILSFSNASRYDPIELLGAISATVPSGITLTSIDINSDIQNLTIGGIALTREDVLLFEERLGERDDVFVDVVSPLENLLTPRDVSFTFRITLP